MVLNETEQSSVAASAVRALLQKDGMEVTLWHELSDFYTKTIDLYDRQFGVMRLIILMMVLLSVSNTINMTLFERTRGSEPSWPLAARLLRCSGKSFWRVLVGACGALLGMALGIIAAWGISAIGIPMPPPQCQYWLHAYIRVAIDSVLIAGLIGWVATILASILPARRASRLSVVDALRHGL
jgi:putative ABC transport system permease protein